MASKKKDGLLDKNIDVDMRRIKSILVEDFKEKLKNSIKLKLEELKRTPSFTDPEFYGHVGKESAFEAVLEMIDEND